MTSSERFVGLRLVTSEHLPRGEAWLVPQELMHHRVGQTFEEWADAILEAALEGRVGIIRGIGESDG